MKRPRCGIGNGFLWGYHQGAVTACLASMEIISEIEAALRAVKERVNG